MIRVRMREKYVIVQEAPWRVYDQFEVFLYATNITFTRAFYRKISQFFIFNQLNS